MARQKLPEEPRDTRCEICGATKPYHQIDCYKMLGRICPECGAWFPRHYNGPSHFCSQDVLHFSRWWLPKIPKSQQEEVLQLYNAMEQEARAKGRNTEPPKPKEEPRYPHEQIINPIVGKRIVKAITFMALSPSLTIMLQRKRAILKEIAAL